MKNEESNQKRQSIGIALESLESSGTQDYELVEVIVELALQADLKPEELGQILENIESPIAKEISSVLKTD